MTIKLKKIILLTLCFAFLMSSYMYLTRIDTCDASVQFVEAFKN